MPHYKCTSCRIRLHAVAPDPGRLCPECGTPLEPVGDLSQLVGCRSVTPEAGADRWLDDGGALAPEAVAVALPPPPD